VTKSWIFGKEEISKTYVSVSQISQEKSVEPLLVTSYFLMMKRGYQIFTGDYSSLFREGVKNNIVLDYPMSMAAMLLSHAAITFETQNEKLVPILLDIGWPGINMGIVRAYKFMGNCTKYVLMNLDQTIVRLEYIGEGFGNVDSTNDNYGELKLPHLLETGFP
jgi:hypothetical protein